jgi:hypothetical protein
LEIGAAQLADGQENEIGHTAAYCNSISGVLYISDISSFVQLFLGELACRALFNAFPFLIDAAGGGGAEIGVVGTSWTLLKDRTK